MIQGKEILDGQMIKVQAPLGKLNVSLFASVLLRGTRELFSYDQLTDVDTVAQEVRDHLFSMTYCSIGVSKTNISQRFGFSTFSWFLIPNPYSTKSKKRVHSCLLYHARYYVRHW